MHVIHFIYFQVGILDINKVTNVPVTMKPFTSEEVYKVTWGFVTDKSNTSPRWALFASSKTKLVYFPEKDKGKLCSHYHSPSIFAKKIRFIFFERC